MSKLLADLWRNQPIDVKEVWMKKANDLKNIISSTVNAGVEDEELLFGDDDNEGDDNISESSDNINTQEEEEVSIQVTKEEQ